MDHYETNDPAKYLTPANAAVRFGLSLSTIYAWKREGRISFSQPGGPCGKILIPVDAIQRLLRVPSDDPRFGSGVRLSGPAPKWMQS
jgi:excisionase family DNA binding protein